MGRTKKRKPIRPGQKVARHILIAVMKLLFKSMSGLRFSGPETALTEPCVIAVFHDELLPLCRFYRHQNFATIASQNHFGYAIAMALEAEGYEVALGSPSRGGQDAFFQLIRAARKGKTVVFTVDGSRGPRHKMKPGAVMLARKTRLPLYLLRAEFPGLRIQSTWDKFKIPRPLSRVTLSLERFPLENYADDDEVDLIVADAETALVNLQRDDYLAANSK